VTTAGGINAPVGRVSGTVGIVGAGAAGCAAAFELQKCGAKVTLFDAETDEERADARPPGGRSDRSQIRLSEERENRSEPVVDGQVWRRPHHRRKCMFFEIERALDER
jgi:2-polyprenyl-6-methoxyphenol hydroxylase-like FAD-dependent oxidoreductase